MQKMCKKTGVFGLLLFLMLMVSCVKFEAKTVQAATGWVTENGNTYYYKANGTKVEGWLTLNGNKYYFYKNSGIMATGWVTNDAGQKRYFYKGSGIMATGWVQNSEGKMRYFDESTGIMYTGWMTNASGQKRYFYTGNGYMATGWVQNSAGQYRYFDLSSGIMTTGWLTLSGQKYYFYTGNGVMATGWVKNSAGKYRYFDPKTGVMTTGWLTLDGKKYYFSSSNGYMATGWITASNGSKRYFDPSTGAMVTGWLTLNGNKYYFSSTSGYMATGWVTAGNGKQRYFDPKTGVMTVGTITMDGIQYTFDSNGYLTKTYDPSKEPVQPDSSKTIKNYLANALTPVGKVLYVWGGGWGNATTKGIPQTMLDWYNVNDSSYDFNNHRDLSASTRAKGFDCSGFVGWAAYQVMHTKSGEGYGYTTVSGEIGSDYASYGWGDIISASTLASNGYNLKAGDVGYNNGHTWIILGQCSDKSAVIIHSTNDAGVQIAGTPTPSGNYVSEATALARKYMSTYPGFTKYYYHTNSGNYVPNNDYFRWNRKTLADPDGYTNMTAAQILYDLFGY